MPSDSQRVSSLPVNSQHICVVAVWLIPQFPKNSDIFAKNKLQNKIFYIHSSAHLNLCGFKELNLFSLKWKYYQGKKVEVL